jgi:hypothetical protein
MTNQLKVGDTVFVAWGDNGRRTTTEVVTAIGREWVYLGSTGKTRFRLARALPAQLDGRGYASPGTVFASAEAYETHRAAKVAYSRIKNGMGFIPPEGVSLTDLQQAAALLRIPLDK